MSEEELTGLEKELERLKKREKRGLWKRIIFILLFVALILFSYDLFQDLETQKTIVSRYEDQIKKLKDENKRLRDELSQCKESLSSPQGGEDGNKP